MINKIASATMASAFALALGFCAAPSTANAAGFFEQLFGMAPHPAPQAAPAPSYGYDQPQSYADAPAVRHHVKRKVVSDDKPKLQKPTDLMHDATLQTGDAVMTKRGIEVYVGEDRDHRHDASDFAAIDSVQGMPNQERKALVAMDTTRNDPLRGSLVPDTIASGRSAAVAAPIAAGHPVVDAQGKTVRYVGP